ncbi:hypothetical protein [Natrinema thermotolerans]|uniref:hypothetical protein n=1 Tax=Natrinema thermotolerans TaxID=121872 RepID=UPI00130DE04A|nr:hypothetical protein [Natrinema thermotolerans]
MTWPTGLFDSMLPDPWVYTAFTVGFFAVVAVVYLLACWPTVQECLRYLRGDYQ